MFIPAVSLIPVGMDGSTTKACSAKPYEAGRINVGTQRTKLPDVSNVPQINCVRVGLATSRSISPAGVDKEPGTRGPFVIHCSKYEPGRPEVIRHRGAIPVIFKHKGYPPTAPRQGTELGEPR